MPKAKMQAKKLFEITPHQAERAMFAMWQLYDVIKALSQLEEGSRTYATPNDFFNGDEFTVQLVANEDVEKFFNYLGWAINLGIVSETKFVMTLPVPTVDWLVKHSPTYTKSNIPLRLEALKELYQGKAKIVGDAE